MVILAQTSASLFADDYDDVVTKRMSVGAGVPAITSAQAVGRAVRALGARRVAIVSPYVVTTNQASVWAMLRAFNSADRLPTFGRLLAEVPADAS
jgi:maleate cis-trans isomerase